jgi:hypothetical protein
MENKKLRKAIASLDCANCGISGYSQCAHSNSAVFGKGRGMKATDVASFPLCCDRVGVRGCHTQHDQYDNCSKEHALVLEKLWIIDTYIKLMELGYLKVTFKG